MITAVIILRAVNHQDRGVVARQVFHRAIGQNLVPLFHGVKARNHFGPSALLSLEQVKTRTRPAGFASTARGHAPAVCPICSWAGIGCRLRAEKAGAHLEGTREWVFRALDEWRAELQAAWGQPVLMSGSGPTLLGFFLDWIEITLIVLPLVAPAVESLGFDLVWFTVLFAVCLQTSFLTPPVGFALFYLKGVAPEGIKAPTIYRGVIPFIALQVLALGLLFLWPALVTWLPSMAYD